MTASTPPAAAWLHAAALALLVAGCASPRLSPSGADAFGGPDLARPRSLAFLDEADVPVVAGGRALPIVAADSPRAVGAALELAGVIRRATGVKPEVLREFAGTSASRRPALFVGATAAASEAGLSAPDGSPEAFRVAVRGGSVFFLGREDFAVYDWCERQLGARCFWHDPAGDELSVPPAKEVMARAVDYSDAPEFEMRVCGSCAGQRWAKFSKVGSVHRGGVNVHAPHGWHRDAALVAERPGIFARSPDGRRATSPLLCYGNPETLEYYERRIDEEIDGVRDSGGIVDVRRKVITVSPWDVAYNCTCGHCSPLYDESLGERGFASPIVWGRFLKGLAKWAKERHPDYIISFLPYWNMCETPRGLDLREEGNCEAEVCVMPGLALMKDESVKRREEEIVRKWTEVTGRKAVLWHYTCWPAEHTRAPYLFGGTIRRHWQEMRGAVDGCYVCGGAEAPRLSLACYVWMRAMWNPDLDVEAVYDVFAERMFGAAVRPMRRLVALQEAGWSRKWMCEGTTDGNVYGISYPPWTVREMKDLLKSAGRLAASDPDPECARRVARYASMFADFFEDAQRVHGGVAREPLALVRADSPPVLDGDLGDDCWRKAEPRAFVRAMDAECPEAKYRGTVRGAWLDDGLVLGFVFEEPAVWAMPTRVDMDDSRRQDLVNVFLSDASDDGRKVFRLRFDADGRMALFEGAMLRDANGARVAVRKGDGSWCAELYVPFSAIGGRPAKLAGNVSRWRVGDSRQPKELRAPDSIGEWTRLCTRFSNRNSDPDAFVPFVFLL